VYLAVILDAWSRRVVGYAISRAFAQHLALPAIRLLARLPVLDPLAAGAGYDLCWQKRPGR
jgi:hypothetical protein